MHKAGKKTHRDYLREDVEYCLSFATSPREFESQLFALGYTLDPVRFSVKAKHWDRAVRLSSIGFSKDRVNAQLRQNAENRYRLFTLEYRPPYKPKKFPLEDELRKLGFSIEHSHDAATVLVDTLFYIIITVVQIVAELADVKYTCLCYARLSERSILLWQQQTKPKGKRKNSLRHCTAACPWMMIIRIWSRTPLRIKSYYVEGGFSYRIHMTAAHLW